MTATRRLAAIMAVDVVGYSRLMGEDEAGTARAVREHREAAGPLVAASGGRVVKTMGDGLLLEFPSVVAAVECAIWIQELMVERNADIPEAKRIVYRVGVNLGDVMIDGDDILGDGVNIAARLEGLCEPGGVLISGAAHEQTRGKIKAGFVDIGERALKNIADPVRAYALQAAAPGPSRSTARTAPFPRERHATLIFVAGMAAVIAVALGAWPFLARHRQEPTEANNPAPAHLSVVVLPFTNLSGDPAQDYLADGVTDNLTTDLSRIRDSFVIARSTAFTFRGKSIDAKQIGKDLDVRYVLEGSVQRDQNRVRVNAQLIDSNTGAHIWADRFEEDLADLFKLQDQVVARLANALNYELIKADAETGARAKNPDALDLIMRGNEGLWRFTEQPTEDNNLAIRALFEKALVIDANDAQALAGDAVTYDMDYVFGWTKPNTDYEAKILGQADRAIALAPDTLFAYTTKSLYLSQSGRASEALRVADAELEVNPNYAPAYAYRSVAESALGQFEQAKADVRQAIRLSPRDPRMGLFHDNMAAAEFGLGHFDAVIEEDNQAIDSGYKAIWPYLNLAAAYAGKGDAERAKTALAEARRLNPNISVKWLTVRSHTGERWLDALRQAGLPET